MGLDISKRNMLFQEKKDICGKNYEKSLAFFLLKNEGNAASSCCSPGVGGFHHKKVSAVPATKPDTPGKNSESDSEQLFRKFPPKYLPKMLPNLLPHYSSFPQISPSFHILRFKRAPQLRPSHKGCGEGKFLYFFSLQNLAKLSFELLQTNNSKLSGWSKNSFDCKILYFQQRKHLKQKL